METCQTRLARAMARSPEMTTDQKTRMLANMTWGKAGNVAHEAYINGLLSGPVTHGVNISSNAITMALSPTEDFMKGFSAAARLDFAQAGEEFAATMGKMTGLAGGVGDVAKLAAAQGAHKVRRGLAKGATKLRGQELSEEALSQAVGARPGMETLRNVPYELSSRHELDLIKPALSSEELGAQGKVGVLADFMGDTIRIPGKMLMKEDKAFKVMHYRMEVNAAAARQASRLQGSAQDKRFLYNMIRQNPSDQVLAKAADMADYYTFTNQLDGWAKELGKIVHNNHPVMQVLFKPAVPFFRTISNIVNMGTRYSVIGNAIRDLPNAAKMTSEGDAARAKIAIGTLIPGAIVAKLGDDITGHIDESSPEGRFAVQTGKDSYAISYGDGKKFKYGDIPSLRYTLGLLASYKKAADMISDVNQETGEENPVFEEMFGMVAAPFINTAMDDYILQNLGSVMHIVDAVETGNTKIIEKAISDYTVNSTPWSQFWNQTNKAYFDQTYRKSETYLQKLYSRTPGLSSMLPSQRTIWGDERVGLPGYNPGTMTRTASATAPQDKYDERITELEVNIPQTPKTLSMSAGNLGSIDLELDVWQQSEFDRIRGKGVDATSPSLKDGMKEMMDDPFFQSLSDIEQKDFIEDRFNQATRMAREYMLATETSLRDQFEEKVAQRQRVFEAQRQRNSQ